METTALLCTALYNNPWERPKPVPVGSLPKDFRKPAIVRRIFCLFDVSPAWLLAPENWIDWDSIMTLTAV